MKENNYFAKSFLAIFLVNLLATTTFFIFKICQKTVDATELSKAIELSSDYLIRICNENGKFEYRINLNPDVKPKPKYNILRHAGTIYALATCYQGKPEDKTRDALIRAANFLKQNTILPIPGEKDMVAVWSLPKLSGKKALMQAKLGGAGLSLISLAYLEKVIPGSTPVEDLRKLAKFILFMQKNDGSFYSKYIPKKGGRNDKWTSLYYPGEAALGLLMLYEIDPAPEWLQAAADAIGYLTRKRSGKLIVEADHWSLISTSKLLPLYNQCNQLVPKKAIIDHAVQICESILATKANHPEKSPFFGCFSDDGRTCPTATRLEGLLATLNFLPLEEKELRERITNEIHHGMTFLLRSQIRSGHCSGGIPRAIKLLPINHPRFSWSFNNRATEVRIDYVQHTLSAMIEYNRKFLK